MEGEVHTGFFCRWRSTVTTVTIVTLVTIQALPTLAAAEVPSFDSVKNHWTSTEGALLDRHGELIHELRVIERGRRKGWRTPAQETNNAGQTAQKTPADTTR